VPKNTQQHRVWRSKAKYTFAPAVCCYCLPLRFVAVFGAFLCRCHGNNRSKKCVVCVQALLGKNRSSGKATVGVFFAPFCLGNSLCYAVFRHGSKLSSREVLVTQQMPVTSSAKFSPHRLPKRRVKPTARKPQTSLVRSEFFPSFRSSCLTQHPFPEGKQHEPEPQSAGPVPRRCWS
jgi:hypothetical protein